jgi:hypothetical protein
MGYALDFVAPEAIAKTLADHGVASPYEGLREPDELVWSQIKGWIQDRLPGSSIESGPNSRAIRHPVTGISVTVGPGLLYLEVPFWHMDEWPLMLQYLRLLAREIEDETGTVAIDAAKEDRFVEDHVSDIEPAGLNEFLARRNLKLPG